MKRDILTPTIVFMVIVVVILFLWAVVADAQTHTFPGNNVFPSTSTTDFNAGATVDFTGATVTGIAGGGAVAWGSITGTLSSQTDLNTALSGKQPLDADLTTIAGLTATTDNFLVSVSSLWASRTPAQVRTTLGLVIGTNVQAWDTDLDVWATKTPYAGTVVVTTGKTFTSSNTLTLAGTDGSTLTIGGGGTLGTAAYTASTAYQAADADLTTFAGITPTTVGQSFLTLANPGAITFPEISATNVVSAKTASQLKTDLSLTATDVGLGSVTNNAQTQAAIVPNTAPSAGQILIGNAGNTAYAKNSLSGSGATMSLGATGVLTISAIPESSLSITNVTTGDATTSAHGFAPKGTVGTTQFWRQDWTLAVPAGGGGAPTGVDYLVGTADGTLSAEIVVGTAPGGELGGTWASPTLDDGITVANWTLTTPQIAAISNLTTNGFVKTGGAIGTLSVDTATYQPSDADLTTWAGITPGTNVGTWLATPSSANLRAALTDENGTGVALFNAATTPDFTTGITIGAAAASRKMLVGDGTKFAASTETWAVPGASTNNVLKSDGTNWTAAQLGFSNLSGNWTLAQGPSTTASKLLGRTDASAGIPQEITLGTNLSMSGTTLNATGGGGTTFIGLTDVPASYSGSGGKVVAVNSGATALEFVSAPAAGAGGSNTQVQYNNSGSLGGVPFLTYDGTNMTFDLSSPAFSKIKVKTNSGLDGYIQDPSGGMTVAANAYHNGTDWTYAATGAVALMNFNPGAGSNGFYTAVSGTGGTQIGGALTPGFIVYTSSGVVFGALFDPGSHNLGVVTAGVLKWDNGASAYDIGFARNAAGVVEVNNGTAGQYRDLKVDEVDAVTGYKLNGTTIALDYSNTSVTNQTPSTSDVYLAGSSIVVPAGGFKASGQYRCLFDVVKSAGTGTIVLTVRIGTLGTTGDTSRMTFTFPAGTSVADTGNMEVIVNFRTVGSGTSAVISGLCRAQKNLITAAGLWNNTSAAFTIVGTVSGGFDSSAATTIGVSFNGGTAFSGTITSVQSNLFQK